LTPVTTAPSIFGNGRGLPRNAPRIRESFFDGIGMSRVSDQASLAARLCLSAMPVARDVAECTRPFGMSEMSGSSFDHCGNYFSGHAETVDALVSCYLVGYQSEKWSQRAWNTAYLGFRKLRNSVDVAAQTSTGNDSPGSRATRRQSRGRRNFYRWIGGGSPGPRHREKSPGGHRGTGRRCGYRKDPTQTNSGCFEKSPARFYSRHNRPWQRCANRRLGCVWCYEELPARIGSCANAQGKCYYTSAQSSPRSIVAQAMDTGYTSRIDQQCAFGILPRRIHFPVQSPALGLARKTILPAHAKRGGYVTGSVQFHHQTHSQQVRPPQIEVTGVKGIPRYLYYYYRFWAF